MSYRILIVDDEEPARDLLESYADKLDDVTVVAVVSDALSAKKIINDQKVDILLSDIQMQDLTGIDLLRILKNPPVTIFTTAYSEYALESFELDVADYLVKPISFQRFCKAMDKVVELIEFRKMKRDGVQTTDEKVAATLSEYFFVKTNRKVVKVFFNDILFVESYGEYVKIYTSDDVLLALKTSTSMQEMLPSEEFIRVHRSYIVNIRRIDHIEGNAIYMDTHRLTISKRMKDRFMKHISSKGIV